MSPSGFQRLIGNRPTCPRARIWRRQAAPYRAIRGDITSRARLSVCGTAPSAPEAGALSLRFLHTDPIFLKVPFWFRVGLREPRCRQRACIAALLSPDWIRAIDARDCVSTRSNSAIRTARARPSSRYIQITGANGEIRFGLQFRPGPPSFSGEGLIAAL